MQKDKKIVKCKKNTLNIGYLLNSINALEALIALQQTNHNMTLANVIFFVYILYRRLSHSPKNTKKRKNN
jgi:hypothetical protein